MTLNLTTGTMHASCVDFEGFGVLILGGAGSGKSTLALACLSLGARLVCDDLVTLEEIQNQLVLRAPDTALDAIEVRRIGLVPCDRIEVTKLDLVIKMDAVETDRLPVQKYAVFKETRAPLIFGKEITNLHHTIQQFAKYDRANPNSKIESARV